MGPIIQEGQDIIRAVPGVDAVLLKEVAVPKYSLPEVSFAARLNVFFIDRNEIVPVWPCVLVDKSYSGSLNCFFLFFLTGTFYTISFGWIKMCPVRCVLLPGIWKLIAVLATCT